MATQFGQEPRVGGTEFQKSKVRKEAGAAGAATEAVGGAVAIALAIIALAGGLPYALMSIATIVLGVSLVLDGGAVSLRYGRLASDAWGTQPNVRREQLAGGISAEMAGGIAGVVLGILALIGIAPVTLCAVSLLCFGAALLFGSLAKQRFGSVSALHQGVGEAVRRVLHESENLTAGGDALVGVGAIVLGILALIGINPVTLVLVGFLGVGFVLMMGGSTLGTRLFQRARHAH